MKQCTDSCRLKPKFSRKIIASTASEHLFWTSVFVCLSFCYQTEKRLSYRRETLNTDQQQCSGIVPNGSGIRPLYSQLDDVVKAEVNFQICM